MMVQGVVDPVSNTVGEGGLCSLKGRQILTQSRSQLDCPVAYSSLSCPILEMHKKQWQLLTLMAGGKLWIER